MARIERHERRVLHAVWPKLVTGPISGAASEMEYLVRTRGSGLTPGEAEAVLRDIQQLREISERMVKIYFRLKR